MGGLCQTRCVTFLPEAFSSPAWRSGWPSRGVVVETAHVIQPGVYCRRACEALRVDTPTTRLTTPRSVPPACDQMNSMLL